MRRESDSSIINIPMTTNNNSKPSNANTQDQMSILPVESKTRNNNDKKRSSTAIDYLDKDKSISNSNSKLLGM